MGGFLFDKIIFGPVRSRRLGNSLGINLLPILEKHCSYDCVYCECGWTPEKYSEKLPSTQDVIKKMQLEFKKLQLENNYPDNITFAGNGEPTMHPGFSEIIDETIALRNELFPKAEISVLSNACFLNREKVVSALKKIDNNIQKLDAGTEKMFQLINKPKSGLTLSNIIDRLSVFKEGMIIQTLFMKGVVKGDLIDNTTDDEIQAWLSHLDLLRPEKVMIYPVARSTPDEEIERIDKEKLMEIGDEVRKLGLIPLIYD